MAELIGEKGSRKEVVLASGLEVSPGNYSLNIKGDYISFQVESHE